MMDSANTHRSRSLGLAHSWLSLLASIAVLEGLVDSSGYVAMLWVGHAALAAPNTGDIACICEYFVFSRG